MFSYDEIEDAENREIKSARNVIAIESDAKICSPINGFLN